MTQQEILRSIYTDIKEVAGSNSTTEVEISVDSYTATSGKIAGQGGFNRILYKFNKGVSSERKDVIKRALLIAKNKLGFGAISEV